MSTILWAKDPKTVQRDYFSRHGQNGIDSLFLWATWAVEGLYYLVDLDDKQYDFSRPNPVEPYPLHVVDIAHARWAAGTAITALDLCAAALARQYCNWTGRKELDLRGFDKRSKQTLARRGMLPASALAWVDTVHGDSRYKNLLEVRNPLTHSLIPRTIRLIVKNHSHRAGFRINNTEIAARDMILQSRDLAFECVNGFLQVIDEL